jgi:hypothetical protein
MEPPPSQTGRADFPHPAFQLVVGSSRRSAVRSRGWTQGSPDSVRYAPPIRAALQCTRETVSDRMPRSSPGSALAGTRGEITSCSLVLARPPSCLPLLHERYLASALLRKLCHLPGTALRAFGHELRSLPRIVIPDSPRSNFLPFCLQLPYAFLPPRSLSRRSAERRSCLALRGLASGSRLRPSLAGSPIHQAESSSTWSCLRTGSSLPVAPHPVSRRRSYLQLRTASVLSGEDFHLSVGARFQAHERRFPNRRSD